MLSISTSWNWNEQTDIPAWLARAERIGFQAIELGYTISAKQLKILEAGLKSTKLSVSSIHNFCPIPDDEPSSRHPSNYYRISSLDAHERAKAVQWTNICVDTAKRVGAPVVVIHAGTVEFDQDPSKPVLDLFKKGENKSPAFDKAHQELLRLRAEKRQPHLDALKQSLKKVVAYAKGQNIKIGLETRYYPIEIPNFEEIGMFLELFHKDGMFYWHDVGHAEIQDRLGITPHTDFLKAYAGKMIGMHIHGMKIARDHLAPFDGDLDLGKALAFLKPGMIKVVEARHAEEGQIVQAFARLKSL